jgi:Fur family ferric uptake transcriptional regulator
MIRQTRQREAILRTFETESRPLSAAEVHSLAITYYPKIGLRTVYRNIRELVQDGKLAGVDYPGQPLRYERVIDKRHKPHLICRHCRKVFDLDIEVPEIQVKPPEGFIIEGDEVVFYGRCVDMSTCPNNPH